MTEQEKKLIYDIKCALSGITQGQWVAKQREFAGGSCAIYLGEFDFDGFDHHKAENAEFITNAPTWLSSLITTIESQTEQFNKIKLHAEHLQTLVDGQDQSHTYYVNETETLIEQKDALIESQKEEIRRRVIQAEINIGLGETVINMQAEIESLKAITELAVKGLEQIMQHAVTGSAAFNVAVSVSKQIERLQNG